MLVCSKTTFCRNFGVQPNGRAELIPPRWRAKSYPISNKVQCRNLGLITTPPTCGWSPHPWQGGESRRKDQPLILVTRIFRGARGTARGYSLGEKPPHKGHL